MYPKLFLTAALLLLTSTVFGQSAVIIQLPTGGHIGIVYLANGETVLLTEIQYVKAPNPSPPLSKVSHALILMESGESTPETGKLFASIRNDQSLTKKVTILDPDTKDENNQPDPQIEAALKLVGDNPLPVVVGFGEDGKPTIWKPLDLSFDKFKSELERWGL